VRLSPFELDRREERRALIAAARANGVEQVVRDCRVYTLVHLPTIGCTLPTAGGRLDA
jgi:hypothetical protein